MTWFERASQLGLDDGVKIWLGCWYHYELL